MTKGVQRIRNWAVLMLLFTALGWFFAFRIVIVPSENDGLVRRALVLKRFDRDKLKPGDLVWVELKDDQFVRSRSIRRILSVRYPDPSERRRAGGGRGRAAAQALLDADFKPTYAVAALDDTNRIDVAIQWRIKGIVIHVFER